MYKEFIKKWFESKAWDDLEEPEVAFVRDLKEYIKAVDTLRECFDSPCSDVFAMSSDKGFGWVMSSILNNETDAQFIMESLVGLAYSDLKEAKIFGVEEVTVK
ncbi:MAG: hypothetical protein PF440_07750 [Thiomicrorhabdus sp.]|jgi:hypothetical protein|nr:hypothetical protein [Thiomicrorhabdus sp.]